MVINTASGAQSVTDSFDIRRSALTHGVPHYTTIAGARAAVPRHCGDARRAHLKSRRFSRIFAVRSDVPSRPGAGTSAAFAFRASD